MPSKPFMGHTRPLRTACGVLLLLAACNSDGGGGGLGDGNPLGGDGDGSGNGDGDGSGNGNGDGDGDGSGNGDGDGYNGDACQSVIAKPQRIAPHMLILFDRSLSMGTNGRWNPSVAAVKGLTTALDKTIQF